MPGKLIINVDTPTSYHPVVERFTPPSSPHHTRRFRHRRNHRQHTFSTSSTSSTAATTIDSSRSSSPRRLSSSSSDGTPLISATVGGSGDLDELTCACCYSILHEPTTLTCGHTFCRSCIATWYLQSKQTSCPECRQKFYGVPQINIMIRLVAIKLHNECGT